MEGVCTVGVPGAGGIGAGLGLRDPGPGAARQRPGGPAGPGADRAAEDPENLPGPALAAVPRAECGPGSRPLAGHAGPRAAEDMDSAGRRARLDLQRHPVSNHPTPGGFRVWRYVDRSGRDVRLLRHLAVAPANCPAGRGPSPGVAVLDMTDPEHPVETATLTTPAMLSPHESLNLNVRRGLLAAETGNRHHCRGSSRSTTSAPDCRHPVLQSATRRSASATRAASLPTARPSGPPAAPANHRDRRHRPATPREIWTGNSTRTG